jgi:glycosyltransferase involved in cell wall biosynthesis
VTAASIVITNHDHGRFVAQAIDGALAQTHAAVEVVVVDDGSADDSRRIIEGYDDAVQVLFREHGGQARAMLDGFGELLGVPLPGLDGRPIPGVAGCPSRERA